MHPLAANIDALRRRLVREERLLAACRVGALAVAIVLTLGTIDYWLRLADRGLRVMLSTALAAGLCWAAYRWWWLPRRRHPKLIGTARRVEAQFPQLHDRLTSALEFLGQSEDDPTAGSAALRRAVVAEADLAVAELPIDTVIDGRPLRQAARWAALAAAAVAALLLFDAGAVGTAVVRLVAPWGATEWPRTHHLAFRDPPTRLAAGQTFEVELFDRGGTLPENVRIEYRQRSDGRSEVQSEWMNRVGDVMVARKPDVRDSFSFRAVGGDDRTMRWHAVEVVAPPQLETIRFTLHPPEYTGLPATSTDDHLRVLAGTGIEVAGEATEPLGAARFVFGDEVVEATIGGDAARGASRAFTVAADRFVAEKSGRFALELANVDAVSGTAGEWTLQVEPDSPPTVKWRRPQADLYVLPTATVPIEVTVKDNLAIAGVNLHIDRTDKTEQAPATIKLYRGPTTPPINNATNGPDRETRTVEYAWPLAESNFPIGTQLSLVAVATDYRPSSGRTVTPRRVTIISREELDARLADRQSQIVRRLEEARAAEQRTRDDIAGLEIQLRDAQHFGERDLRTLQSAELAQRRIHRSLTDANDGVPALVASLADELRMNGLESHDVVERLQTLVLALDRLSAGPLAAADQELTAARKGTQTNQTADVADGLAEARQAQEEVLRVLESSLAEMQDVADLGHLVRELAQLRTDQLAHAESTRSEVGLATLPLELRELSRQQRAALNRAAATQDAISRRYERIEADLDALGKAVGDDAAVAGRIDDALELARERAIAGNMRQASRDLATNRVGQALVREAAIVQSIDEVLERLRDRSQLSPEELIARLQAAERRLASLQQELAELKKEVAEAERSPAEADRERLEALRDRQRAIQQQAARLARELTRLNATAASRSTEQAADKLADHANATQPSESRELERAEQDLAEAAQQLAARRAQAEDDWAQKFLERFQAALATMVADQKAVIAATEAVDAARGTGALTGEQRQQVAGLATKEHELADDANVHRELLAGLRVFGVALEAAGMDLTTAAERLLAAETGTATQAAEQRALARFEQIVWALEQTAAQAQQPPPPGQPGNAAGAGQQPRPLFDLFEVKLLRMLQADLNERTQALETAIAADGARTRDGQAALNQAAEQLAAEQARLAELAAELATRDNTEGDEPP